MQKKQSVPDRASVGVGVIIERDGKILLMKRQNSHGDGTWSCPGGHIDFGESIEECACREVYEETSLEVDEVSFEAITNDVFELEKRHYITVWVRARYVAGTARVHSARESTQVDWFPLDSLPAPLFLPLEQLVNGRSYPRLPLAEAKQES